MGARTGRWSRATSLTSRLVLAASSSTNIFPDLRGGRLATANLCIDSEKHRSGFKERTGGPAQSDATPEAATLKKIVLTQVGASTLESANWIMSIIRVDVQPRQRGETIQKNSRRALNSVRRSPGRPTEKTEAKGKLGPERSAR